MQFAKPYYIEPMFFQIGPMMSFYFNFITKRARFFQESFVSNCIVDKPNCSSFFWVLFETSFLSQSVYLFSTFALAPCLISFFTFFGMTIFLTLIVITFFATRKWDIKTLVPIKFGIGLNELTDRAWPYGSQWINFLHNKYYRPLRKKRKDHFEMQDL